MVKRKFLKDCCIKGNIFIIIVLSFTMCVNRKQSNQYENKMIDSSFLHTPFVAINVLYNHDVYRILIEESSINILPESILLGKKSRNELYPMFRNDTLDIDSIIFDKLKKSGNLVMAQTSIDSVYSGKVKNILSTFFNKNGVLTDSLSDKEQVYIVYLLFKHKIYVKTDCETGLLYIINY